MELHILKSMLTGKHRYWIIEREFKGTAVNSDVIAPSIMMIMIPSHIRISLKHEDIKLTDLEELEKADLPGNIFLNKYFAPFQMYQNLVNVVDAYPIMYNHMDFLKKALNLESDKFQDYINIAL